MKGWDRRVAFDKIAYLECLLPNVPYWKECRADGYQWKPGTDDLTLGDARAKWALDVVLGVKLPQVIDRSTPPERIERFREDARLAVEAYRQGVIGAAADNEIPPAEYARLRHTYFGRIPEGPWPSDSGILPFALGMDEFLLEWRPIGRKYEDLVSLIGVKGFPTGDPKAAGVVYSFQEGHVEYRYYLRLQNDVIWSVRKTAED